MSGATASMRLYTDGASRGNPGDAGAGFYLCRTDGEKIAAGGMFLGSVTNNVAEYRALILGLEQAIALNFFRLVVCLDSELVVRQITGRYKVRHPALLPLYEQARELVGRFSTFEARHIPREQNREADALANRAIDERWLTPVVLGADS